MEEILKCSYGNKDFIGVLCRCALIDTEAKLKSDNKSVLKESFKVRNHAAHEETYTEVTHVEFIKDCSVGTPMHVMLGSQSWIIKLAFLYEKFYPDKNSKCTWRLNLKSPLVYLSTS